MPKEKIEALTEEELLPLAHHILDVSKVTEYCNPFVGCWMELEKPITKEEVLSYIKQGKAELVETPIWTEVVFGRSKLTVEEARERHIKKIAYFATNDIEKPISIDVGIPDMGCYVSHIVDDGNHRLAGAIIKGQSTIKATVSGAESHAKELGLFNPNEYQQYLFFMWEKQYNEEQKKISSLTIQSPKP